MIGVGSRPVFRRTRALTLAPQNTSSLRKYSQLSSGSDDGIDGGIFENGNAIAARGPEAWVGRQEDGDGGDAGGSGEVSDAGIVADEEPRSGEEAGEIEKIFDADGVIERVLGAGAELDGEIKRAGDGAVGIERPIFFRAGGEGVNDGEIFDGRGRDADARSAGDVHGKRGKKREGEMADGVAEIGTGGAVPGMNGIEGVEIGRDKIVKDAHEIELSIGEGAGAIGELNERQDGSRSPDFSECGRMKFKFGEREDQIADGAGADEKTAMGIERGQATRV